MSRIDLDDDAYCFCCGPDNPIGLKLAFEATGQGGMRTIWTPRREHQGFKDIVHGGLVATVLDEVMVRLLHDRGIHAVTAGLETRLMKPVRWGRAYRFEARITAHRRRAVTTEADAFDAEIGAPVAWARATCIRVEKPMSSDLVIRERRAYDSVTDITALLHAAYAGLAARGFRYVASHQDDDVTRRRLDGGTALLVEREGRLIATVTLYAPRPDAFVPWYRNPGVFYFGQFGVLPSEQGGGIGGRLIDELEARALAAGAAELALDTAEGASHLVAWYSRRGYRFVEHVTWPVTNYRSVVLSKRLDAVVAPHRTAAG